MSGTSRHAVVDQATSVLQKVKEYIDAGMESTIEVAAEVAEQEKELNNGDNKVNAMKDVMMRYVKMDKELNNFIDATNHAKQFVLAGGDLQEMENELDKMLGTIKREDDCMLEVHPKYVEMNEKIQTAINPEAVEEEDDGVAQQTETIDEDIAITQDAINTKCPYTRQEMTDPVKNKYCGHVYDKQGVQELCKKRLRPKCPIPGCVNQRPISMEDMEEDKAMKKMIRAHAKKSQRGGRRK